MSQASGIEKTPDVCGGSARIARSRVPVWTLVRLKQLGASDEDILRNYPALSAGDLANAWAYDEQHRNEIDRDIRENETET